MSKNYTGLNADVIKRECHKWGMEHLEYAIQESSMEGLTDAITYVKNELTKVNTPKELVEWFKANGDGVDYLFENIKPQADLVEGINKRVLNEINILL